ncbi:MAG: hypothetical protein ABIR36_17060 [Nitrospiraceae bacterium]
MDLPLRVSNEAPHPSPSSATVRCASRGVIRPPYHLKGPFREALELRALLPTPASCRFGCMLGGFEEHDFLALLVHIVSFSSKEKLGRLKAAVDGLAQEE